MFFFQKFVEEDYTFYEFIVFFSSSSLDESSYSSTYLINHIQNGIGLADYTQTPPLNGEGNSSDIVLISL
jgi:hypothetical protein